MIALRSTIFILLLFILAGIPARAQQQVVINASSASDTIRTINIVQGKNLRQKTLDSTVLETIAGDVIIKEGLTTFYCDSAALNRKTNILEAYGNIHINDNDSIHTYAQSLRYVGAERIAYLKKNVRLTDKKGTLYTDDLEYNLRTGIATYKNGGRIVNGKTELTSLEGVYIAETKDVYFKKNVHLKDPDRDIWTDSLLYNIKTNIATFISKTRIIGKDGSVIDTKSGTYDAPIVLSAERGTDGSRLSFMGLPCPNIFAGEHAFHSRLVARHLQSSFIPITASLRSARAPPARRTARPPRGRAAGPGPAPRCCGVRGPAGARCTRRSTPRAAPARR